MNETTGPASIVVLSAGVSEGSTTRLLGERLGRATVERLTEEGVAAEARIVDLAPLAVDTARAIVSGLSSPELEAATAIVTSADALVLATPVYKAGVSGLMKSYLDTLDTDALIAMPAVVGATGGSPRHAMVPDEQLRPLLAYFRAIAAPTAVYAAPEDWGDPGLTKRIRRAAIELAALVRADARAEIVGHAWQGYQHDAVEGGAIDFDSDLMRLATGGARV